jgi:hypothetical protein
VSIVFFETSSASLSLFPEVHFFSCRSITRANPRLHVFTQTEPEVSPWGKVPFGAWLLREKKRTRDAVKSGDTSRLKRMADLAKRLGIKEKKEDGSWWWEADPKRVDSKKKAKDTDENMLLELERWHNNLPARQRNTGMLPRRPLPNSNDELARWLFLRIDTARGSRPETLQRTYEHIIEEVLPKAGKIVGKPKGEWWLGNLGGN